MTISIEENKLLVRQLLTADGRPGIDKMLEWLDSTDFYTAPASTRYHLAVKGGLCQHSLNVYDQLAKLVKFYGIQQGSVSVAAICHDFCKINMYAVDFGNKKIDGQWVQVPFYTKKEKFKFGGHGAKSVFLTERFIHLADEEAIAIHNHMSCWSGDTGVGDVFQEHQFAWLLHVADEAATYYVDPLYET